MENREESRRYWKGVEQEVGESIRAYALGQLQASFEDIPALAFCLFFLTDTRLFIRYIPPERRILSLPVGRSGEKRQTQTYTVLRSRIRKAEIRSPKRGLWSRWSSPLATLRISFIQEGGGEAMIHCTMESRKNEFLRNIEPENLP